MIQHLLSRSLLRVTRFGPVVSPGVRRLATDAVTTTKVYPRPAKTRDLALDYAGRSLIQWGLVLCAAWAVLWFAWIDRYKKKYIEFIKNDDPEKAFFRQCQAGVFQSVRPVKPDNPEYWMGTYRGSKGSESKEDFLALIKKFPELQIKVLSK